MNRSNLLLQRLPVTIVQGLIDEYDPVYKMIIFAAGYGEQEWAQRLLRAATDMGWTALVDPPETQQPIRDVDIVVYMRDPVKRAEYRNVPSYLTVTDFNDGWRNTHREALLGFQGFLYASPQHLAAFKNQMMKPVHAIPWYPSCAPMPTAAAEIDQRRLFYCGAQWDARRTGTACLRMLARLSNRGILDLYGPEAAWCNPTLNGLHHEALRRAWLGELPVDGLQLLRKMQASGAALILHTHDHLQNGAITSRVFEAAASGAIMISDRHPFIVRHFADCALFLDEPLDADQVLRHWEWIATHPLEVAAMTKKASQTADRWNLYTQLDALVNLNAFCS